jgi:hypothetical protein
MLNPTIGSAEGRAALHKIGVQERNVKHYCALHHLEETPGMAGPSARAMALQRVIT